MARLIFILIFFVSCKDHNFYNHRVYDSEQIYVYDSCLFSLSFDSSFDDYLLKITNYKTKKTYSRWIEYTSQLYLDSVKNDTIYLEYGGNSDEKAEYQNRLYQGAVDENLISTYHIRMDSSIIANGSESNWKYLYYNKYQFETNTITLIDDDSVIVKTKISNIIFLRGIPSYMQNYDGDILFRELNTDENIVPLTRELIINRLLGQ